MKRMGLAILVACGSGCGGPELMINFEIPEPYRAVTDAVTLRIYEPPAAAPFGCEILALGEVELGVLSLSLVGEFSLRNLLESPIDQLPVGDIDRTARKLFVAQGQDDMGMTIVSGCTEQGEVEGRTTVRIVAEPNKLLSVQESPPLSLRFGEPVEEPIVYEVTDLMGTLLPEVEVRWRINGAGGVGSNGRSSTNLEGRASILPTPPSQPGPFVLDVNIRWAVEQASAVSGFIAPQPEVVTLAGRVRDYKSGRVGPNGEPGLVALLDEGGGSFKVIHLYRASTGELLERFSQSFRTVSPSLGIIEYRGFERDRAIVVGVDFWVEVSTDGGLTERDYFSPIVGAAPLGIYMSGECADGALPEIFMNYDLDVYGFYRPDGFGVGSSGRLDIIGSGCVGQTSGGEVRVLLLPGQGGNLGVVVAARGEDTLTGGLWLAIDQGLGFTPALAGAPKYLIGSQLNRNDVVVSRSTVTVEETVLVVDEQGVDLIRNCMLCLPLWNRGGDVDGDGIIDLVTLIQRPRANMFEPVQHALYTFLGREHRGERINADVDVGPLGMQNPVLLLNDLDRDGHDDVILAERPVGASPTTRVEIYPMAPFETTVSSE